MNSTSYSVKDQLLEIQFRRQAALAEIELAINQPHELQAVLQQIVIAVTDLLPASGGGSVVLWDAEQETFFTSASTVPDQDSQTARRRVRRSKGATRWIVDQGEPMIVANIKDDPFGANRMLHDYHLGAYAGLPLLNEGEVLGVLYALDTKPRAYTRDDIDFLKALARRAAVAIIKVRLYEQLQVARDEAEIARKEAETANEAKSRFLANMSHELRSPLTAIMGFSDLMQRDPESSPGIQDYAAIVHRSGHHLLTLINDILDLAKIEAGRETISKEPFDLYAVVNSLTDFLGKKAEQKNLLLTCEIHPDVPRYLNNDVRRVRQVLLNLVGNAIKFTDQGSITCQVTLSPQTTSAETPSVLFAIADTGAGIAADDLDQLFEPFVQTETGIKAQMGTGLGLAVSRQYVRLMGGELHVVSKVGEGSVFSFDLPYNEVVPDLITAAVTQGQVLGLVPGQPDYRLLIVDDRAESRTLLEHLLQRVGFKTRSAANGREAVAEFENWHPHLIFMDMRMPVMDGFEAAKIIKMQERGRETAIVAVTASVFEEDRDLVYDVGCDGFIRKPYNEQEIIRALEEQLGLHSFMKIHSTPRPIILNRSPPQNRSIYYHYHRIGMIGSKRCTRLPAKGGSKSFRN